MATPSHRHQNALCAAAICRLPFTAAVSLDAGPGQQAGAAPAPAPSAAASSFSLTTTAWTKMKANMDEVPYSFEKGQVSTCTQPCR